MEPESSLLCSHELATGPYPEPDVSVHNVASHVSKFHSNIILQSTPETIPAKYFFRQ